MEKNIPMKQLVSSSLICRICGDKARGLNFDVMSCMSCKAFFRRNALQTIRTLRCIRRFNCEITKEKRQNCAACRLKKCFEFGMKPQLIRSFKSHHLSTPQPLSLLQNDRSTTTVEQWNLISNIIHAYDEKNFVNRMKCLLEEGSSLPIKMRTKPSFALNCVRYTISFVESLLNQSSHFHSLPVDTRRALIIRNTIISAALNNILTNRYTNFLSDPNFVSSFNSLHGSDLLKRTVDLSEQLDRDTTVVKIMVFAVGFSNNCSVIKFDSSHDFKTMSISVELIHVQNTYITVLWKYLLYHYGFSEAVLRYSTLIKTILNIPSAVEETRKIEAYEQLLDTSVKQIEKSLVIEG